MGVDYVISCDVNFVVSSGAPAVSSFQWLGPDGNQVNLSNGFMVLIQGSTSILQFGPAHESHEGNYTCQASVGTVTLTEVSQKWK